jgi:hypothetical protein
MELDQVTPREGLWGRVKNREARVYHKGIVRFNTIPHMR